MLLDELPHLVQWLTMAAVLFALAGIAIGGVMLAIGQRRPVPLSSPSSAGGRPAPGRRSGS